MLLLGEGTTVDREAALRWFARAAEGGYCEAMRVLADAYSTGLHQVPTDARLAAYWSKRLAKHLAESPDDLRAYERAGERRGED
jgi:TPR repeat protein